jgi:protease I
MSSELEGLKIAILVANGFEQVEMTEPQRALQQAGAVAELVSPEQTQVKGWNHKQWGDSFKVDVSLRDADADDYDALMLPGGVMNPDKLRMLPEAVDFVKDFVSAGKPIAAICHAPWTLIEAEAVQGCRITSWPSLKTDLENAGADWVDEEVVRDDQILTSRKPDDLPAFNREMIRMFSEMCKQAKGTFSK